MNERVGLFQEGGDFDLAGFEPKKPVTKKDQPASAIEALKAVSEKSQFRSRESAAPEKKREPMRHRTGRNAQLNVKLRAGTIESFYEIARRKEWTLGETLESALAALEAELSNQK